MKKLCTTILTLLFISYPLISSGQGYFSQSRVSDKDYQAKAAQIRAEVWSWDIPAFSNYSVPEEYAGESAVILAQHRQIDATARKGSFWTTTAGKLFYSDIERSMIKINDQAALTSFSEYSFSTKHKIGATDSNVSLTIIGVRIIKPDGTISEVDVLKNSVSMTKGKNDKEAYRKLAIPELQKGDILDQFYCRIYELSTYNLPTRYIPFFSGDYFALNCSCQLAFGKNLTIEYRSINGAPVFTRDTDSENNVILRAEAGKVMRINDIENLQWLSSSRDLPMISFAVLQNASKVLLKPKSARPIGIHENVSYDQIIEDAKWYLASHNLQLKSIGHTKKMVSDIVANYKRNNPGLTADELADVIYAALNFKWNDSHHFYNSDTFTLMLDQLLKENGIESRIGYATNKYTARKDEVVDTNDLYIMIVANNGSKLFFTPYRYRIPGEIPSGFQGETATVFTLNKIIGDSPFSSTGIDAGNHKLITIPESDAEENVNTTCMEASILSEDNGKLLIKRNSTWVGGIKRDIQPWLLTLENWDTTMRHYLHIDKSIMDELNEKRGTRKWMDQVEGNFEKEREKYAETIKHEIVAYHGADPEEVKDYAFTSFGITKAQPNLIYDVTYTMDGFVRTIGENFILDAGKLIGEQWNPTDNERIRNVDAYVHTARTFKNEISFKIPAGYQVGDIEHLNVNYSNEYISFESNAVVEGDSILIKTKKTYNKAFVPKEKWDDLIDIIDKTNNFYSSSIILQKY